MTAAFSFNCPECGKTYENVKANMAGRKVSCTCGKVFRLGPKTEEQVAARAKRKAEKLAARENAANNPPTLPTVSIPSESAKKPPTQTPANPRLFEAEIPGLEDELDANPVARTANQPTVNPGAFEGDPLPNNPVSGANSRPVQNKSSDSQATPPLGWALATPEPAKKTVVKKSKKTCDQKRGPITRVLDWFANLFSRRR